MEIAMYAYVVRGSEDGNIGVYSSRTKARKACKTYLRQDNPETPIEWSETKHWGQATVPDLRRTQPTDTGGQTTRLPMR